MTVPATGAGSPDAGRLWVALGLPGPRAGRLRRLHLLAAGEVGAAVGPGHRHPGQPQRLRRPRQLRQAVLRRRLPHRALGDVRVHHPHGACRASPSRCSSRCSCRRAIRGVRFFRTAFALPFAFSVATASVIFGVLYNPASGVLNGILSHLGIDKVHWLTDPDLALWSVSGATVWMQIGYNLLVISAGLGAPARGRARGSPARRRVAAAAAALDRHAADHPAAVLPRRGRHDPLAAELRADPASSPSVDPRAAPPRSSTRSTSRRSPTTTPTTATPLRRRWCCCSSC